MSSPGSPSLLEFSLEAALRNPRERDILMKLDRELFKFLSSPAQRFEFPELPEQPRALLTKMAGYYGLDFNIDLVPGTKRRVVLEKPQGFAYDQVALPTLTEIAAQRGGAARPKIITRAAKDGADGAEGGAAEMSAAAAAPPAAAAAEAASGADAVIDKREEVYRQARERIFGPDGGPSEDAPPPPIVTAQVPRDEPDDADEYRRNFYNTNPYPYPYPAPYPQPYPQQPYYPQQQFQYPPNMFFVPPPSSGQYPQQQLQQQQQQGMQNPQFYFYQQGPPGGQQ